MEQEEVTKEVLALFMHLIRDCPEAAAFLLDREFDRYLLNNMGQIDLDDKDQPLYSLLPPEKEAIARGRRGSVKQRKSMKSKSISRFHFLCMNVSVKNIARGCGWSNCSICFSSTGFLCKSVS
jgi:hypothetical protein